MKKIISAIMAMTWAQQIGKDQRIVVSDGSHAKIAVTWFPCLMSSNIR